MLKSLFNPTAALLGDKCHILNVFSNKYRYRDMERNKEVQICAANIQETVRKSKALTHAAFQQNHPNVPEKMISDLIVGKFPEYIRFLI